MAKIQRSNIHIKDNETGEVISYESETMPFECSVGTNWFVTAGPKAAEELQRQGYEFYSEDDFSRAVEEKFGLTAGILGKRGAAWNTPEARARYTVKINGVEFAPALSPAALRAAEAKVKAEREVKTFSLPRAKAMADSTPKYNKEALMAKIVEFKAAGNSEDVIVAGLTVKLGNVETAKALVEETLHPKL